MLKGSAEKGREGDESKRIKTVMRRYLKGKRRKSCAEGLEERDSNKEGRDNKKLCGKEKGVGERLRVRDREYKSVRREGDRD